jgi:uncharacterized membrane protein
MYWIVPLIILVLLEATADIISKTWQIKGGWYFAALALLAYLAANAFWLLSLKNGAHLSKGAVLFSVMSAVLAVIIGVVVYKENLNTVQTVGLVLGIISIAFIFWE